MADVNGQERARRWTFLTNHAHVLLCVAREPDLRLREIAEQVQITERAAQLILSDLIQEGYVVRTKIGRRNNYHVNRSATLRHPLFRNHEVSELIDVLVHPVGSKRESAT